MKSKYIIVIGCGRLGSELAVKFSQNHSVVVIDKNEKAFSRLVNKNFTGFTMTVDTNDMDALKKAKLDKADIVYIVTPDDNLNFMLAYGIKMIKKEINKEDLRIVARVNDPMKKDLFQRAKLELFCPIENSANQIFADFKGADEL
ncbi:hypothetical protein OSSY52_15130 [Tepiditoga spiralis]|uniref:RCK N-terminal domain-containing protein n=1 Tax=Tepiditoga spiralis TaxID=2108365 RepID=A0A7G1GAU6_9BACT|nr:NAD(P)-binding protein [Tepiditoga spiralis]BBE31372.1 hypothetical protein OSSY52_15130 [Tepiditoga spiralis]